MFDIARLANEVRAAFDGGELIAPLSSRDPSFDLDTGYAIEAELRRLRRVDGWHTVGLKVGYANKALWRVLKLETLVWAAMYDRTVHYADAGRTSLSVARMISPKIEPEIVVRLARPVTSTEPHAILAAADWIALGFEIIDCVYPDWQFQPADFVAAFGLHAALVIGEPQPVSPIAVPDMADQLSRFRIRLSKDGSFVEEGAGRNALKSPALCVGELLAALKARSDVRLPATDLLISTGTLTASHRCFAGERWTVEADGLDVRSLALTLA